MYIILDVCVHVYMCICRNKGIDISAKIFKK